MEGMAENINVRVTLKLRCDLKKKMATKSCVARNIFLSGVTVKRLYHSAVGILF